MTLHAVQRPTACGDIWNRNTVYRGLLQRQQILFPLARGQHPLFHIQLRLLTTLARTELTAYRLPSQYTHIDKTRNRAHTL